MKLRDVRVQSVTAERREEWNAFVAEEPYFALQQSWEWGEFKQQLGWTPLRVAAEMHGQMVGGAQVLLKSLPLGLGSVAYIPRGPIGKWMDAEVVPALFAELDRLAQEHRAVFLKVEPGVLDGPGVEAALRQQRFLPSAGTNQPRASIIVNLDASLDDILGQMRRKTRQYVRSAGREGITVRVGGLEDVPALHEIMRFTAKRNQFAPRVLEYYQHEWETFAKCQEMVLLLAHREEQLLSALTVMRFGRHAAQFHGGSVQDSPQLHPNYLLAWEAIQWARARGCSTLDLWGIPDEVGQAVASGQAPPVSDRTDGLWGVYRFKKGFSENIVYYAGAYDHIYDRVLLGSVASRFMSPAALDRGMALLDRLRRA